MSTKARQSGWTPASVQRAVALDVAAGLSTAEVSRKHGISQRTAQRLWAKARQEAPAAEVATTGGEWRVRLAEKSVRAVERALEDRSDHYRAGAIAVSTLKGLNVFTPDGMAIYALIATTPESLRARYIRPKGGPDV